MNAAAAAACLCTGLVVFASAHAQPYPTHSIRVIVPMQSGTAGDTIVRVVAARIASSLGATLVIDKVTGAAGAIGAQQLARAPADGYTIGVLSDSTLTVVPNLQPRAEQPPLDGLEPVSMIASITSVLVVHPSSGVDSVEALVALAKAHPGVLDYASGGIGSQQHLAMAVFSDVTGARLNHIPFRGLSQAAMEVVSGRIPVMFVALSIALPFIKEGRLRALAVASKARSSLVPSVPTMSESGLPGFVFTPWVALYAPKGTPGAVVDRLNREVAAAVGDAAVRASLLALGLEPESSTPAELEKRTRSDFARMEKLIRTSGIRNE